ncbi:MAG: 7-carboxy-7-deazaguanine synthase QueE [Candidatus Omnitrophica bacterium]|nr:7-carboxy-7-deazaguanine synthase QueE [Candidatus Omnitrophota bacterium]MDD5654396.1 7-carboxy-7-deazaguanine synthase QueE [Candidatus Omnitrophota bacterium]
MKGRIAEIFESIQGEGIYAGERQIFIRFFGCNLNCGFCDTKPYHFVEYEPGELLAQLKHYRNTYHSISFTGGEPLLQKDFLKEAMRLTQKRGFKNYLETNGTLPAALEEVREYVDIVAMDLKFPSSTNIDSYWDEHRLFLAASRTMDVFLKAVVCESTAEEDLRRALGLLRESKAHAVLVLQPNSYEDNPSLRQKAERFRDICLSENIASCVIPQIHRLIGVR